MAKSFGPKRCWFKEVRVTISFVDGFLLKTLIKMHCHLTLTSQKSVNKIRLPGIVTKITETGPRFQKLISNEPFCKGLELKN